MIQETSLEAYASIQPYQPTIMEDICELFCDFPQGLTCEQVEHELGLRHQTASSAIRKLVQEGILHDSGQRRVNASGRKAIVWTFY